MRRCDKSDGVARTPTTAACRLTGSLPLYSLFTALCCAADVSSKSVIMPTRRRTRGQPPYDGSPVVTDGSPSDTDKIGNMDCK